MWATLSRSAGYPPGGFAMFSQGCSRSWRISGKSKRAGLMPTPSGARTSGRRPRFSEKKAVGLLDKLLPDGFAGQEELILIV
jgi:hypothetical protein